MKLRNVVALAVVVAAAMFVGWQFAALTAEVRIVHGYHGLCNHGVGRPYEDFIRQLRTIAESGDTNKLMTVLRRADEHSSDIYEVWLDNNREAYRKSLDEILK